MLGLATPIAEEVLDDDDDVSVPNAWWKRAHEPARSLPERYSLSADDARLLHDRGIAAGSQASVVRAELQDGCVVAAKVITSPQPAVQRSYLLRELHALSRVQHTNVVRLLGTLDGGDGRPSILMPLGRHTLEDHVEGCRGSSAGDASLLRGVANGMHAVHAQGLLHLDLKPANVLIGPNLVPWIADFGLCTPIETAPSLAERRGTTPYAAPELFAPKRGGSAAAACAPSGGGARCGAAVDVYAFAIVAWHVLTRRAPWAGDDEISIMTAVREGERPAWPDGHLDKYLDDGPAGLEVRLGLVKLVLACWAQQPEARPSFAAAAACLEAVETRARLALAATSMAAKRAELRAAVRRVRQAEHRRECVEAQLRRLDAALNTRLQSESQSEGGGKGRLEACGEPGERRAERIEACGERGERRAERLEACGERGDDDPRPMSAAELRDEAAALRTACDVLLAEGKAGECQAEALKLVQVRVRRPSDS